jgi:hypothetical protein
LDIGFFCGKTGAMSVPVFLFPDFMPDHWHLRFPYFSFKKIPAYFFSSALISKHPFQKERNTYLYGCFSDFSKSMLDNPVEYCLWVTWRSCVSTLKSAA